MSDIINPFSFFSDLNGKAMTDGYVYVGASNQNPEIEEQQIALYWDAEMTQPAAQPLRTIAGYLSRNGSPAKAYGDGLHGGYSLTVRDRKKKLVFHQRSVQNDKIVVFNSVNELKSSALLVGVVCQTLGYYDTGDRGAAYYQITENQSVDGYGSHIISNGNAAVLSNNQIKDIYKYGAKGDGSNDDTLNIQSSLNTEIVTIIPDGNFLIKSALTISSEKSMIGVGAANSIITGSSESGAIDNTTFDTRYTSDSAMLLAQGELSGDYTPIEGAIVEGIRFHYDYLEGRAVDGIVLRNAKNCLISQCMIDGIAAGTGISGASLIEGCVISDNNIHDIKNNTNWGTNTANINGIMIDDDRVNSIKSNGVIINSNNVSDISHGSVYSDVYGDQADGIGVQNGSFHKISGNIISDVNEAIDIYCSHSLLTENVLDGHEGWGIKLIHGAEFNVVSNNKINNCGTGGIVLVGGSAERENTSYNVVTNNNITNTAAAQITANTASIMLDNQGNGKVASKNIINNNVSSIGANCKFHIMQQQAGDINNVIKDNIYIGTPTDSKTNVVTPDNEYSPSPLFFLEANAPSSSATGAASIVFTNTVKNSNISYNTSTGAITFNDAGFVNIEVRLRQGGSVTSAIIIFKKNSAEISHKQFGSISGDFTFTDNISIFVEEGDEITPVFQHSTGSSVSWTGSTYSYLKVT